METYLSSLENFFNDLETDFFIFQNENSNFLNNIETSFATSNIDTLQRLETDGLVLSSSTENIVLGLKQVTLQGSNDYDKCFQQTQYFDIQHACRKHNGQINSLTLQIMTTISHH